MSGNEGEENVPNSLEVRITRRSADALSRQPPIPGIARLARRIEIIYGLDWSAVDISMGQRTNDGVGQIQITSFSVPSTDMSKSEEIGHNLEGARAKSPLEEPVMMDPRQILQCTICLDFAASPIFTCANAHVICGVCVKKLNNCPTCKLKTLTNNSLADKVAKDASVMLLCPKSDFGCNEILSSTKLVEHLHSCFWRDIPCYEIHGSRCSGKELFQIDKFLAHLESAHNLQIVAGPKHNIAFSYPGEDSKAVQWATSIFKFDKETFFNFSELRDGNFHLWIATIGDEEKAGNYEGVVNFVPPADGPNYKLKWRNEITATLPVFPIHQCPRVDKSRGRATGQLFPIMTIGMLKTWTRKTVVNNSEHWFFKITISIQRKDQGMET